MKESNENGKYVLWGTICGDVIGSRYERRKTKDYNFQLFGDSSRFTDDTVCTVAVADALMNNIPIDTSLQKWGRRYPRAGYGFRFYTWIHSTHPAPYNSYGNGSAMRVSACGALANTLEEALELAKTSAECTHNHPEGIKGAQATAMAIYLAKLTDNDGRHLPKETIKQKIEKEFGYDLKRSYKQIKENYKFDVRCQRSVPEAIVAFMESDDYESTIRLAVSLGGDADTLAAIAGGIAAAYYGCPPNHILNVVRTRLPKDILDVITKFESHFRKI